MGMEILAKAAAAAGYAMVSPDEIDAATESAKRQLAPAGTAWQSAPVREVRATAEPEAWSLASAAAMLKSTVSFLSRRAPA